MIELCCKDRRIMSADDDLVNAVVFEFDQHHILSFTEDHVCKLHIRYFFELGRVLNIWQ